MICIDRATLPAATILTTPPPPMVTQGLSGMVRRNKRTSTAQPAQHDDTRKPLARMGLCDDDDDKDDDDDQESLPPPGITIKWQRTNTPIKAR